MDAGDRERARYARRQVIAAKDRAKFSGRQPAHGARKSARKSRKWRNGCWSGWKTPRCFPPGWKPGSGR